MSDETALEARRRRIAAKSPDGSIRGYAGKGVLVNASWSIGLQGVHFLRGVVVAAFLVPSDFGIWAILLVGYLALGRLKAVGIVDKYIQQDDPDEEVAFQKAFTLETILMGGFWVLLMLCTPLLAVIYRAPEIIAPGLVALLAMPGALLQTPVWAFQREMDFSKQRRLMAIDPLSAAVVTIGLAIAGFGYWSFAIGNVVGAWTAAVFILRRAPYPLRFRYDRGTARQYVRFSTPILYANMGNIVLLQGTLLFARSAVGIAGIGALALANSVRNYTEFADGIISQTMYPAICAARDKREVLRETFIKSNRLALMWGFPIGIGMVLFADDFVRYVIGDQWAFAIPLFQAVGAVSAIGHVAFNWDGYIRALGDTRPIARYAWIGLLGWAVGPIPLMFLDGLRGYGLGLIVVTALNIAMRAYFMRQVFPGFGIVGQALRAMAPTVPAVAAVLVLRLVEPDERTLLILAVELGLYFGLAALLTWMTEKVLLREAVGYLRRGRSRGIGFAT